MGLVANVAAEVDLVCEWLNIIYFISVYSFSVV